MNLYNLPASAYAAYRAIRFKANPLHSLVRKKIESMYFAPRAEILEVQQQALRSFAHLIHVRDQAQQASRQLQQLDPRPELNGAEKTDKAALRDPRARPKFLSRLAGMRYSSSGTTGTGTVTWRSPLSITVENAIVERHRVANVGPYRRIASFIGRRVPGVDEQRNRYWVDNLWSDQRIFSYWHLSDNTARYYYAGLREWMPEVVQGYPSFLSALARMCEGEGLDLASLGIRGIFTGSEKLTIPMRDIIQRNFGCQIYDVYGQSEGVLSITQCSKGAYHIDEEFSVLERLEGKIYATSIWNHIHPLVRYEITDVFGEILETPCGCGRHHLVVTAIDGREEDYVIGKSGRIYGRLDHLLKGNFDVAEAQFIQEASGVLQLMVVQDAHGSAAADISAKLTSSIRSWFGEDMDIRVHLTDRIERERSGKLKFVKRLAPK